MSRLKRKKRTDIIYKGCGGLTDAFDDALKQTWYINDEEYDFIAQNATDEELDLFLNLKPTRDNMRKALMVVDKLLDDFNKRML